MLEVALQLPHVVSLLLAELGLQQQLLLQHLGVFDSQRLVKLLLEIGLQLLQLRVLEVGRLLDELGLHLQLCLVLSLLLLHKLFLRLEKLRSLHLLLEGGIFHAAPEFLLTLSELLLLALQLSVT